MLEQVPALLECEMMMMMMMMNVMMTTMLMITTSINSNIPPNIQYNMQQRQVGSYKFIQKTIFIVIDYTSPCESCSGQSGNGTGLPTRTSVFLCKYNFANGLF